MQRRHCLRQFWDWFHDLLQVHFPSLLTSDEEKIQQKMQRVALLLLFFLGSFSVLVKALLSCQLESRWMGGQEKDLILSNALQLTFCLTLLLECWTRNRAC